ncbi:hypothetical protein GDO86_009169 [Hymenochirus boettgeri]|uniref:Protein SLX4IP n=1 Tax=Hymenochirus boettgeri TaxID=247094 RepID=A0A8T2JHV5_9PIPI|nr:hypothetical protein GDO86_009169 [Hymenochirus boettgeri]
MANKLVLKCGNFAVLVDLQVLPQGTSKDTSWFSDHEKEEVCMLVKDTIDSRVKQHIENRKQQGQLKHKEYTQSSPLFLKGNRLRIAAYFIKRWVKLRCVMKKQYRELNVFPDRFVVCASQLGPAAGKETHENSAGYEKFPNETSEYFDKSRRNETNKVPQIAPNHVLLRNIVRKTKAATDVSDEAERDSNVSPSPGLMDTANTNENNKAKALSSAKSEEKCTSAQEPKNDINTSENSMVLPVPEVENAVNHRHPSKSSSQRNPQSAELKTQDLCDSAIQTIRTSVMQQKRRRSSSVEEPEGAVTRTGAAAGITGASLVTLVETEDNVKYEESQAKKLKLQRNKKKK